MTLFWGPGVLLILLTGPLGGWARTLGWTAGLLWLAGLCVWNYARCRRVHCAFTGPFFLVMAGATLTAGAGLWSIGPQTWSVLGDAIAIGGFALCFGPELIWGRYWGSPRRSDDVAG
ncbi:MAG TPA: hypothetical protein VG227_05305 [Caulobacteraceae bacterium]|nr:hypothetical protein [Caulobacteraceae bacterium]